jgi:DNA-binding XRE family transcriptional regulator
MQRSNNLNSDEDFRSCGKMDNDTHNDITYILSSTVRVRRSSELQPLRAALRISSEQMASIFCVSRTTLFRLEKFDVELSFPMCCAVNELRRQRPKESSKKR